MADNHTNEFDDLVMRHFDQGLSSDEGQILAKYVAESPVHAHEFARAAALHHQMRTLFCTLSYESEETPRHLAIPLGKMKSVLSLSGLSVFACLLIAVISLLVHQSTKVLPPADVAQGGQPTASTANLPAPVAYLTSNAGCAWRNGSAQFQTVGSGVQPGDEISLLEGIAEFRLANGVYLSLEGPTGLVMTSTNSLVHQYGKITAHVPWSVSDFKMIAGTCRFQAANAEFGIYVAGGRIDAHVFSGEVLASDALRTEEYRGSGQGNRKDSQVFTTSVIPSGRSITLKSKDGVLHITNRDKAIPSFFATRLTMAGILPVSQAYTDAVLASHPAGYWRFESGKNGVVSSDVPTGSDLNIVGDLRLSGTTGNRMAEFRPGSDCYLVSREPLDFLAKTDYTMEAWVKPSHVHWGAILGLCATDPHTLREQNAFLLELMHSGDPVAKRNFSQQHPRSIRFLHRDPPERRNVRGTSCFSDTQYRIRRWQQVVAVKDGDQMRLYIDGKLVANARDNTQLTSGLHLVVGRQETVGRQFQFIGQLDELSIYSRAMTAEEIMAHYKAIDWSKKQNISADQSDT